MALEMCNSSASYSLQTIVRELAHVYCDRNLDLLIPVPYISRREVLQFDYARWKFSKLYQHVMPAVIR